MFSRFGALVISTQGSRRQQLVRSAGNLAAVSLAGGLSIHHWKTTKLESAVTSFDNDTTSLVLPTLEATARALRLISTAFFMVADYETAKVSARLFPATDPERSRLEAERTTRRQVLEEAQIVYTSPTPDHLVAERGITRQALILEQKESVHQAAGRLAETDEALLALGSQGSVHEKAANRLLHLCRSNGGVYIKIGQHLANLDYLIPQEYVTVLSSLFNDAPQSCEFGSNVLSG